jgi:hypothetical protein
MYLFQRGFRDRADTLRRRKPGSLVTGLSSSPQSRREPRRMLRPFRIGGGRDKSRKTNAIDRHRAVRRRARLSCPHARRGDRRAKFTCLV